MRKKAGIKQCGVTSTGGQLVQQEMMRKKGDCPCSAEVLWIPVNALALLVCQLDGRLECKSCFNCHQLGPAELD